MDKKEGTRKMSGSPSLLFSWEFRDVKWEISKIYILGIIWQSLYLVTHKSAWQQCLRIFQSGLNHVLTEWFQTVQRDVEILNLFTVLFPSCTVTHVSVLGPLVSLHFYSGIPSGLRDLQSMDMLRLSWYLQPRSATWAPDSYPIAYSTSQPGCVLSYLNLET